MQRHLSTPGIKIRTMPEINFTIRAFSLDDYQAVIKLWKKSGLPHKPKGRDSLNAIKNELKRGICIFLIACCDGRIVGSVIGTHDGRRGWINRLAVDPEYQRQGIAKALLKAAEEKLDGLGLEIITCLIEDWNESSIRFFENMEYIKHPDILYFSKRKNPDV